MIKGELHEMKQSANRALLMSLIDPQSVQRFYSLKLGLYGPYWFAKDPPVENDPAPLSMKAEIPLTVTADDAVFVVGFGVDLAIGLESAGLELCKRLAWKVVDPKDMVQPPPQRNFPLPDGWEKKK